MPEGCSVVIATIGKRRKKLKACLDSLFRQTYSNLEVICVVPVAASIECIDHRARIIQTNDINGSRNKNAGIGKAKNNFVALTDDDCIAEENWVANIMKDFKENDVAAVCGSVYPLGQEVEYSRKQEKKKLFKKNEHFIPPWNVGTGGCICVKKSVIEDVGPFDERLGPGSFFHSAEDIDMIHRIIDAGYSILYDPNVIIFHDKTESRPQQIVRFYRYRFGLGAFFFKIRRNRMGRKFFFDHFLVGEINNFKANLLRGRVKWIPRTWAAFLGALFGFFAFSVLPRGRVKRNSARN
ncbi:MAG: glycosyltransferase [Thermoplasmata archaeon]